MLPKPLPTILCLILITAAAAPLARAQFSGEIQLPVSPTIEGLGTGAWTVGRTVFTTSPDSTAGAHTSGTASATSLTIQIAGTGLNSGGLVAFYHTFTQAGRFMFDAASTFTLQGPGSTYIAWRKNSEPVTLVVSSGDIQDAVFDVVTGDTFSWTVTTQGGVLFPSTIYTNQVEVTFSDIRFIAGVPEPASFSVVAGVWAAGFVGLNRRRR